MTEALRRLGYPTNRLNPRNRDGNTQDLLHWTQTGGAERLREVATETARLSAQQFAGGDRSARERFEAADAWINGITAPTIDPDLQARMARYTQSGLPSPPQPGTPTPTPPTPGQGSRLFPD
jgi:hypothetical protein